MAQNKKSPSTVVTILQIVLPVLGTMIVAYFGYLGMKLQVETPIHATQTAEARQTAIVQLFTSTPVDNAQNPTPTFSTSDVFASAQTSTADVSLILQPSPSAIPSNTPSNNADPAQFIRDYFSLLNDRRYEEAWSKLSSKYKENTVNNGGGGYNEYVSFWNTVDKVEIILVEIRSQNNSEVYIYTEIKYYYKAGYTTVGHTNYKLIKDTSNKSWLVDPN